MASTGYEKRRKIIGPQHFTLGPNHAGTRFSVRDIPFDDVIRVQQLGNHDSV
jgi:hypothetical protein